MRAWRLTSSGTLQRVEMAAPLAGAGGVLVRVKAAGVTPTDLIWYPTTHAKDGGPRAGAVPGHEFSGVVAAVGAGVREWALGDEVFGMNDWFSEGATAEMCVTRPEMLARKPRELTHAEAAATPIGALTAWQGLFEKGKLSRGETVLVHGGSGSVGVFTIQLARRAGARVLTTASRRNEAFLRELGAEVVIDYRTERFEEKVKDVDLVFDGVGGETLARSWGVLGKGGRLVTIAASSEGTVDARTKEAFFIVEPRGKELAEIAGLMDRGELKVVVDAVVGFDHAGEAYAGNAKGAGRGKVVVEI